MSMFCYQCEQTAQGTGCEKIGVCGKDPETAALQDLLLFATKSVSMYAHRARQVGAKDREVDLFVLEALFTTVTNVSFDPARIAKTIKKAIEIRKKAKNLYEFACEKAGKTSEHLTGPAAWKPVDDFEGLVRQGQAVTILKRIESEGPDVTGLQELLTYGLKGMAAYADHAQILGIEDDSIYAFLHEALDFLSKEKPTLDELVAMNMRCGEVGLTTIEILDRANTGAYGDPVPTEVPMRPKAGKAILVSGHDLKDLEELLKQTEGKGINIYTHGEMLPAHGYPGLKKYSHLVGNYGGAWMKQIQEFDAFPGSILMTTNCIQKPRESYKSRIFTSGHVAWPGVHHIADRDFTPLIEAALAEEGFQEDASDLVTTIGFGKNAILGVADKVVEAVKSGAIKHFFLIGGCDGAETGRNYYTEMAESIPNDCVILTLGCGKFRFNEIDLGDIGGIPRRLDMGQCNDAYGAIQVAVALANAFGTDVNSLPLSLIVSWYEQKAVLVLLVLLSLGIKNIRLGPKLPAFVTPPVLDVLVEKFNIMPITTAEEDLKAILG